MAYAHGVTREDVFAAASEIFASGKNPTQATVRTALGRGSFSTISKYLAEWRSQQTEAEAITNNGYDMPEQVKTLLNRTYNAIRSHAEATVVGEQITLLEQENERLKTENVELKQDLIDLPGLRSAYNQALSQIQLLTRENERIAHYLPQIDEVEKLAQKLTLLEEDYAKLHSRNEQLEIFLAQEEEKSQSCERNLQTSQQRANELSNELYELRTSNAKLNQDLTKIANRNQELIEKNQDLETALTDKLAQISELENELKISKQQPKRTRKTKGTATDNDS